MISAPSPRILGIDPGTTLIGWGIIEHGKALAYGPLRSSGNVLDIFNFFDDLITKYQPDVVALEKLFFFKNAKTVMQVSEVRGVLRLVATRHGLEVREFTPPQVKQAISGYGKADKDQVGRMVKLIFGLKEIPKPDDVADALALAMCCANTVQY